MLTGLQILVTSNYTTLRQNVSTCTLIRCLYMGMRAFPDMYAQLPKGRRPEGMHMRPSGSWAYISGKARMTRVTANM